jgi:hypothetical protein
VRCSEMREKRVHGAVALNARMNSVPARYSNSAVNSTRRARRGEPCLDSDLSGLWSFNVPTGLVDS